MARKDSSANSALGALNAQEPQPKPRVFCCFDACGKRAICKVFTATGWANVCLEHYAQVKPAPRVCKNQHCEEIRTALRGEKLAA